VAVSARVEHVGSLLRPPQLLEARRQFASGELTSGELKSAEDRAVRDVVAMQEAVGCPVVTDGELRRESFQSELTASASGFEGVGMDAWLWGSWHSDVVGDLAIERPPDLAVVARMHRRRNLAAEEFTFLRAVTHRQSKVTLPSPTLLSNLWSPERSQGAYGSLDEFMGDVVSVLCDEVRELGRLGCNYVQLDAPHYPLLIDPEWRAFYEARGWSLERWLSYGIELDNAVIAAGSALGMSNVTVHAFVNTQLAAAAALLSWVLFERVRSSYPTTLGAASGAIAGMVAITPCAGFVTPMASILIGAVAGVVCAAAARAKFKLGYDDSLDVLAVHGMGGVVGMVLLGLLATRAVDPAGANGLLTGGGFHFFGLELLATLVAIGFTFTVTWLLAKVVDLTIGLRVSPEDEYSGLDLTQHAESAYSLGG